MQFTSTIFTAALALAVGSYGWAQAADGTWVANDTWYTIRGTRVHEACTRRNSETVHYEGCAYWTNGVGGIFHGLHNILIGRDSIT
ncbi:hypothetical protein PG994_014057 [Apiospora phragmitis]|uniref:Uncharacterized protein n=1 Tax=Apiospora phragmitis TaxID=2905665 RepID=A0ABR1T377_9PEZI